MNSGLRNPWFACPRPNPGAGTRLFLFPYAGGGPASFRTWPAALPSQVETWIAHYPGRGSRFKEAAIKDIPALAAGLFEAIRPYLEKPFAFFGHSMGGLVAFELTRQVQQHGLPLPRALQVSACGAPGAPDPHPHLHTLPDQEFLRALEELNGIPAEAMEVPELMELLLPTIRADFEAVEKYESQPDGLPLHCTIVAFGGLDDPRVRPERLGGWSSLTSAGFRSLFFPGDHFFIDTNRQAVIASIVEGLLSAHARS